MLELEVPTSTSLEQLVQLVAKTSNTPATIACASAIPPADGDAQEHERYELRRQIYARFFSVCPQGAVLRFHPANRDIESQ